ncbi:hypothetical protein EIN43_19540 [Enterobacter hormaechei]|uniref:Uncharacterized protein n=1 Tax=Enterobacter hormaechei TaxID=158836 RepID=A0A4Y5ZPT3_9ENTR|nr:hypothetical protein EIN43_19540 [Enterobacter hormaechei]
MDEFKPEDELKPDPAIVVLVVLVNLQNVITSRRSTLTMSIWMQTIVALRVAATRAMSVKTRSLNPKKS